MGARDREGLRGWRRATLVGIKTVHTAAFFSIGSCLAYFAYSSLAKRSDRRAAIAGAVVTGETIVYALNGFRCPLTSLASGSVRGTARWPTSTCRRGSRTICHTSRVRSSPERWCCTPGTSSGRAGIPRPAEDPGGDAPRKDADVFVVPGSVARFRSTTKGVMTLKWDVASPSLGHARILPSAFARAAGEPWSRPSLSGPRGKARRTCSSR
jgi:hypothetical protein